MRTVILTFYLLATFTSLAGEALGVKYDQLFLARLKSSHKKMNHEDLLVVNGKQPKVVLETFLVDKKWSKQIDFLFPKNGNYDHGLGDCRLQLYSLIFYRKGKVVLSITPNLLGGDLYASSRQGSHSLSSKQRDTFLQNVFFIMSLCEKKNLP